MFAEWQEGFKQAARRAVSSVLAGREKPSALALLVNDKESSPTVSSGSAKSGANEVDNECVLGLRFVVTYKARVERLRGENAKLVNMAKSTQMRMAGVLKRLETSREEYEGFVTEVSRADAQT